MIVGTVAYMSPEQAAAGPARCAKRRLLLRRRVVRSPGRTQTRLPAQSHPDVLHAILHLPAAPLPEELPLSASDGGRKGPREGPRKPLPVDARHGRRSPRRAASGRRGTARMSFRSRTTQAGGRRGPRRPRRCGCAVHGPILAAGRARAIGGTRNSRASRTPPRPRRSRRTAACSRSFVAGARSSVPGQVYLKLLAGRRAGTAHERHPSQDEPQVLAGWVQDRVLDRRGRWSDDGLLVRARAWRAAAAAAGQRGRA